MREILKAEREELRDSEENRTWSERNEHFQRDFFGFWYGEGLLCFVFFSKRFLWFLILRAFCFVFFWVGKKREKEREYYFRKWREWPYLNTSNAGQYGSIVSKLILPTLSTRAYVPWGRWYACFFNHLHYYLFCLHIIYIPIYSRYNTLAFSFSLFFLEIIKFIQI